MKRFLVNAITVLSLEIIFLLLLYKTPNINLLSSIMLYICYSYVVIIPLVVINVNFILERTLRSNNLDLRIMLIVVLFGGIFRIIYSLYHFYTYDYNQYNMDDWTGFFYIPIYLSGILFVKLLFLAFLESIYSRKLKNYI